MTDATETLVNDDHPVEPEAESDDVDNAVINRLRKEAKEGADAKRQLQALQRERAFDKAGIPEVGAGKWFRKGYEGELDADAIKAQAEQDGLIDVSTDEATPAAQEAATSADRIAGAAADGGAPQVTVDTILANASTNAEIEAAMQDAGLGMRPS